MLGGLPPCLPLSLPAGWRVPADEGRGGTPGWPKEASGHQGDRLIRGWGPSARDCLIGARENAPENTRQSPGGEAVAADQTCRNL